MPYGYNGKVLRVNLTQQKISVDEPEESIYRQYFGGTALIGYYLLKEQKPGIDPLGSENRLIFANGVLSGIPLAGFGRNVIGAKSPLTNAFASSEVGGFWGAELKHAGYDAVIIEGKAEKPVYLWIQDGKVEIRDATHLWGKATGETQDLIRQELGDSLARTALIGPGGERQVRFACIVNDLRAFAGRTGMGAVMGSKNLKGIAVRGHNPPPMANPEAIRAMAKWYRDIAMKMPIPRHVHEIGTLGGTVQYSLAGALPTRNFQEGVFAGADKLSPESYKDTIQSGRWACYACPVHCKQEVTVGEPYNVTSKYYGGPEFESLIALGSLCGIDDLGAIAKANELASAYSVDTITLGGTIAFAMECFERGLLTESDANGLRLTFGNVDAMLKAVEIICNRDGIGDILAEGPARAAQKIGKGAEAYAMHAKGQGLAMHNPFYKPMGGVGYALCPVGADHIRNVCHVQNLDMQTPWLEQFEPLVGVLNPLPREDFSSPERIRMYMYYTNWVTTFDCLVLCYFVAFGYTPSQLAEITRGVTGWNSSSWELMKLGERCMNMMRAFNVREGFSAQDDRIPERFHQPMASGPLKGVKLDKEDFERAKQTYYKMMGWDERGIPSLGKLQELGVGWLADEIFKANEKP